jgi:hypothetical protein
LIWSGTNGSVPLVRTGDNPVAAYSFDDGTGAQDDDSYPDDDAPSATVDDTGAYITRPGWQSNGGFGGSLGSTMSATGAFYWTQLDKNHEIRISDSADFDLITTNNEMTASFHFKSGAFCGDALNWPLVKVDGDVGEWNIFLNVTRGWWSGLVNGPTASGTWVDYNPFASPFPPAICNDLEWHHIAMVWDGPAGRLALYIDGVEWDSNTDWTGSIKAGTGDIHISHDTPTLNYNGFIDNVRIYAHAQIDNDIMFDALNSVPDSD